MCDHVIAAKRIRPSLPRNWHSPNPFSSHQAQRRNLKLVFGPAAGEWHVYAGEGGARFAGPRPARSGALSAALAQQSAAGGSSLVLVFGAPRFLHLSALVTRRIAVWGSTCGPRTRGIYGRRS